MAKHLSISGIVQGVGYRINFQEQARALRLSGWIRNRRDGSVEAIIDGNPAALDQIIAWAWQGPPGGQVDHVEIRDADTSQISQITPGKFDVLPTA